MNYEKLQENNCRVERGMEVMMLHVKLGDRKKAR